MLRRAARSAVAKPDPRALADACYKRLLDDQLPNGAWGKSMLGTGELYGGTRDDQGSLSISVFACLALRQYTGTWDLDAIARLDAFLKAHRTTSGAFGMWREMGSAAYPNRMIVEHARHTATAAAFYQSRFGTTHT